MQTVLLFQFLADTVTATEKESLIEPPAVLVHIDRDDVQVVPVYVLVLENKIRLVAVTEFFQILPCNILKLRVRQNIVRVRIERDMKNWFLHPCTLRHKGEESLHRLADVNISRAVIVDAVGGEQPPFSLVDFLSVVGECAVQGASYTDFCDHFASISLESSTI